MAMLTELLLFTRMRKKYWVWPIFLLMAVFGVPIGLAQGSAFGPYIYSTF